MIDSPFISVIILLAGFLLGAFYFGGLWITVNNISRVKNHVFLFLGSLVIRLAIALIGFYFIGAHNWQRMLLLLIGFMSARFIIIRLTKTQNIRFSSTYKKSKNEV
jgi:F1F0 ATPase subunit 2